MRVEKISKDIEDLKIQEDEKGENKFYTFEKLDA